MYTSAKVTLLFLDQKMMVLSPLQNVQLKGSRTPQTFTDRQHHRVGFQQQRLFCSVLCLSPISYHRTNQRDRVLCAAKKNKDADAQDAGGERSQPIRTMEKLIFRGAELLGMSVGNWNLMEPSVVNSSEDSEVMPPAEALQKLLSLYESYYFFVGTGNDEDWRVFEDTCLYVDEFSSFTGTSRFRRNVQNFGSVLKTETVTCKVVKVQQSANSITVDWVFSGRVKLFGGLLAARGQTIYTLSEESGRIIRHDERYGCPPVQIWADESS